MKWVSADEAARALNISKASLYAYVSRGLLDSVEGPDRSRRYRWHDIERLRLRKARPREAAGTALYWGLPTLRSEISTIQDGCLRYRGRDVVELASQASLAQVASLLWCGDLNRPTPPLPEETWSGPFLSGGLSWLATRLESDPAGWDLSAEGVQRTGWKIFGAFRRQLVDHPLLEKALILCADHELNASAFAARVAASTGANPYAVVCAALATLSGSRHGGATTLVEALFEEASRTHPREAVAARLRRGDPVAGFGHTLYPDGDPRARLLLGELQQARPELQIWEEVGEEMLSAYPSVDLALVALGLGPGQALAAFACGRCLGWIAHALEQYADGRMIRPRAGST